MLLGALGVASAVHVLRVDAASGVALLLLIGALCLSGALVAVLAACAWGKRRWAWAMLFTLLTAAHALWSDPVADYFMRFV